MTVSRAKDIALSLLEVRKLSTASKVSFRVTVSHAVVANPVGPGRRAMIRALARNRPRKWPG